jgi:hypothetical protein
LEGRNGGRIRFALTGIVLALILLAVAAACFGGSGDDAPNATPTPALPGPLDAIAGWVAENRSVGFVGDCADAKIGEDRGKLCAQQIGERGRRRAYAVGPTFSEPTALAIVEDTAQGWAINSVTNRDPNKDAVPGIDWPLEVGDAVIVIGLGEGDCLSIREQPSQQATRQICMPDGARAIVQEGPVEAESFTWWRISGEGFNGWAAGAWLRLEDAIRDALNPPAATATPGTE